MRCSIALSFCLVGISAVAANPATTRIPTTTTTTTTTTTSKPSCPYSVCIKSSDVPAQYQREASSYCSYVLRSSLSPVTSTTTVTTTTTTTTTPARVTVTATTVETTTTTVGTTCTGSTVTVPASTFVAYPTGSYSRNTARSLARNSLKERQLNVPNFVASRCKGAIPPSQTLKAACSCLVTPSTTFVTTTSTSTVTVTASTPTATTTTTSTSTVTESPCTSTVVATVTQLGACGTSASTAPTSSATGSITCPNTAAAPSANAYHRIEGNDSEGTIFEGCIVSGPRAVTTPSGGTHQCDGTNNNANPFPSGTITGQAVEAGNQLGFSVDGSWSNQFQDFFITRIGQTDSTGSQFWGVLRNEAFTSRGGCQEPAVNGDRHYWVFNAFSPNNGMLIVTPDTAAAQAGQGFVTVSVSEANMNSGSRSPKSGATIAGQTSDANGQVQIPIPTTPGCYQYKATASGKTRSNAFYLSVYDQFAS